MNLYKGIFILIINNINKIFIFIYKIFIFIYKIFIFIFKIIKFLFIKL